MELWHIAVLVCIFGIVKLFQYARNLDAHIPTIDEHEDVERSNG